MSCDSRRAAPFTFRLAEKGGLAAVRPEPGAFDDCTRAAELSECGCVSCELDANPETAVRNGMARVVETEEGSLLVAVPQPPRPRNQPTQDGAK